MRVTVAVLRRGIVVLACLLVLVLLGFFGYARYRFRRFEKDLPGKLGINIQQTANGFTYSQSSQGHTLFTIHASKLVQYKKDGHATLHDVDITLYGPPGSNRTDRIYGSSFDYDKQSGIATANGEVQIDLAGLESGSGTETGKSQPGSQNAGEEGPPAPSSTIHIKTSGLTFNSKTGDAVTGQHMEFQLPKAAGSSTGASYNSKTGLLILDSDVVITTSSNGNLAVVHAAHAEFLRDSKQGTLLSPTTDYQSEKSSADQAIVYFRKDGTAERIEAQGHVRVVSDDGAVVTARTSQTQLDIHSQPLKEDLAGGVNFVSNNESQSMHGTAVEGTLTFGPMSMLKHAQFRDAVSFVEQVFKLENDPKGNASRQVQASKIDIDFASGPDPKKSIAQKILATGAASVNLHTIPSTGPQQLTNISGDQLLATLENGNAIRQLDGSGNTKIVDLAADGSTSTSKGDRLHVIFADQPGPAVSAVDHSTPAKANASKSVAKDRHSPESSASQVETAIQDGNVVLTQTPKKKDGATADPATLTAWAKHVEYHAADQILHLTGDPRLSDGESLQMAATLIDYHRDSGNATAQSDVKVTYTQPKGKDSAVAAASGPTLGGQGPVHITADRAQLHHATGLSVFYGTSATAARMWQGDNSVLAPVLELSRTPQMLKAHGVDGSTTPVVNANLTSALGSRHQASVVRIHSQTLVYSDADRRGDFRGSVTAEDPDGVIHADDAQVFLIPVVKSASGEVAHQNPGPGQTQVDHIVATGHVLITQPGRKGVGEKLVYTTDDGKYILTGSPGNLPHIYDQAKGTTTGVTLIFNSQDDSVVVSGGQSSAVTETRTPK
jgi:lipopolysaccharide export system protein LptA